MISKEKIIITIREAIRDVTGLTELDESMSLIGKDLKILPSSFLYIFNILEKKLNLDVHCVFQTCSFQVMTIGNLADAFFNLQDSKILQ